MRNTQATAASAYLAAKCPLCGQSNQCAVEAGSEPSSCWCMQASLDSAAKQQAADLAGSPRCICTHCGRSATENNVNSH